MAVDPFTLYADEVLETSGVVTGNGLFDLDVSNVQNNNGGYDSIFLNILYKDILPDPETTSPGYSLQAVIESSDNASHFWPIGTQFEPMQRLSQGPRNIIVVQPNIFNIFEGSPIDLFDGVGVTTRISRQQGILGVDFRIKILVRETKHGTADALQSVKVDVFGERYNHV